MMITIMNDSDKILLKLYFFHMYQNATLYNGRHLQHLVQTWDGAVSIKPTEQIILPCKLGFITLLRRSGM